MVRKEPLIEHLGKQLLSPASQQSLGFHSNAIAAIEVIFQRIESLSVDVSCASLVELSSHIHSLSHQVEPRLEESSGEVIQTQLFQSTQPRSLMLSLPEQAKPMGEV
jgi:hypothetical protein